jgi:hypothetical protein
MKRRNAFLIVAVLVAAFMLPVSAMAENDPRDAIAAPGGTNLFLFYYRDYAGSDFYSDGDTLDSNADFDMQFAMFRFAHFWDVGGGWIWSADIVQPVASMEFESDVLGLDSNSNGLGDTTLATHINTPWFVDNGDTKLGMSAGFYLTPPSGEYHSEKAVNIGSNRWTYRLEATPVVLMKGPFVFELTGEVQFFTDNDDYSSADLTEEKDPVYHLQLHGSYNITDSFWTGLSYYYLTGGETTVAGIDQDDELETQTLRFSFGYQLTKNTQLLLQYNTDIDRDNGVEQNYFGGRIAYCF